MNQWQALGWTLACEVPLLIVLSRPRAILAIFFSGTGASLLTHPLAWHVASILSPAEYPIGVPMIETCVVVAEGLWLQAWLRAGLMRSLGWSLVANAASFLLGYLLT
ncbi:MAG: hypothetical protein V4857_30690 [Pseudomonadota bacterium]